VLQTPPGDLLAQHESVLLDCIAGHEFVSQASIGVDLTANIVVKPQNALVV
jgi:hypothetical protein